MNITLGFGELVRLYHQGFSFAGLLVLTYLRSCGSASADEIARTCRLSERTVFRALAQLRRLGLWPTLQDGRPVVALSELPD